MRETAASAVGQSVFRELDGDEAATVFAHDLEQHVIDLLATEDFKKKAIALFKQTGKFNLGACYPVVMVQGRLLVKVFASVEAARSRERLPAPFGVTINLQTGEPGPDPQEFASADVEVHRNIGMDIPTSVDKVRLESGLTPLVPTRREDGYVVNSPSQHEARLADYAARAAKAKETKARKRAEAELARATEGELQEISDENEARE